MQTLWLVWWLRSWFVSWWLIGGFWRETSNESRVNKRGIDEERNKEKPIKDGNKYNALITSNRALIIILE